MASTDIHVDGPAHIKIASPNTGSLENLGYTMNGAEITEQEFDLDVFSDQNGGDAGPPINIQVMGEVHTVRLLLVQWDETVLNKVRAKVAGETAGTPATPGTLKLATGNFYRLLIHTTTLPRNYLAVTFREPMEINKGTKHSQQLIIATCYEDSNGDIYNATTS